MFPCSLIGSSEPWDGIKLHKNTQALNSLIRENNVKVDVNSDVFKNAKCIEPELQKMFVNFLQTAIWQRSGEIFLSMA